ncbi:hypothetical protein CKO25_19810 [Thiocapsa imhoffii]|uniref:Glycosyltransferase subfamily 4-like N-terminal domain-containing protein n=1 Tax=Thiocapsa imhoffii TaxID=382777 RepID=A0A9X0WLI6_9GAMM|nr:glycosyltransferase family 4 protein [Thiocapsa imhoffii]MBK1646838.1 hypothetical protein [Thiocapsa imhoffii]
MPRILMLNQVAGPLFRELAEDLAVEFGGADLLSGHLDDIARQPQAALRMIPGPDYDRRSLWRRAWSWCAFFLRALREVFRSDRDTLLLIVSNPPFLAAVGWIAAMFRGQRYCVLVYDLYPGVLVKLGQLRDQGLLARGWRLFNRQVWGRAQIVFTIGAYMAENLRREGGQDCDVRVVPVWADVEFVRPLPKEQNPFVQSLGWADRTIVLYSGNLGDTHNLDSLLDVANRLRGRDDLGFLIIGSGSKWAALCAYVEEHQLQNVKLLPFQPESMLPQTLPAGDVAVVSMEPAIAGYMVPSKSYYYLAAGSALLAIVPPGNEVADLVEQTECGVRVDPDDPDALFTAIVAMVENPALLAHYQRQARTLAERDFSRHNTTLFTDAIRPLLEHPVR